MNEWKCNPLSYPANCFVISSTHIIFYHTWRLGSSYCPRDGVAYEQFSKMMDNNWLYYICLILMVSFALEILLTDIITRHRVIHYLRSPSWGLKDMLLWWCIPWYNIYTAGRKWNKLHLETVHCTANKNHIVIMSWMSQERTIEWKFQATHILLCIWI